MVYPMFLMVLLTITVGSIAFVTRVRSVKTGQLKPKAYKLMDAESYPELVIKTTRSFNNQFEIPVLFYVGCLSHLALDISNPISLLLAWCFVGARAIHAFVHITYNHLLHRIIAFWLSVFIVLGMWLNLIVAVS